jgi:hypothetical protein
MLFKNSVRTSKRTPYFTITKINWLTVFKEIILFTLVILLKPYVLNADLLIVKEAGTYSYHSALKG